MKQRFEEFNKKFTELINCAHDNFNNKDNDISERLLWYTVGLILEDNFKSINSLNEKL